MNNKDVVSALQNAVRTHKQWVINALALIEGVPLDQDKVPVKATECAFGKWYYGEGQKLKKASGFKEIEELHARLHTTYMEIVALLFGEEKRAAGSTGLPGLAPEITAENRAAAMAKYHLLQEQSELIIKQLERVQKMITTMYIH
ncbi:CZB domain-containing protein [Candidatus Electronema sp. PJ]|uniref:CZB domain-containing protein n=1 Tax=Candidatus Electronema sp. PJ TaxID=3401572 RepID=UPI003AA8CE9D